MTVQSSFLVRCSLSAPDPSDGRKSYWVQHVQTGAEFRSGNLTDVTEWISKQNVVYLAERLTQSGEPFASGEKGR